MGIKNNEAIRVVNPFLKEGGGATKNFKKEGKTKGGKEYEHEVEVQNVFKEYRELSEIAEEIAKELIKEPAFNKKINVGGDSQGEYVDISKVRHTDIIKDGLTFPLTSENRTGIISLCPAILTALRIFDAMPDDSEDRRTLGKNIKDGIEALFRIIYRLKKTDDWRNNETLKPVFDASPYVPADDETFYPGDDTKGLVGRSYTDAITWAVPVFLRIMYIERKGGKKKGEDRYVFNEYRARAQELAKWCLDYVNSSLLTFDYNESDGEGKKTTFKIPAGWNYTKLQTASANDGAAYKYLSYKEKETSGKFKAKDKNDDDSNGKMRSVYYTYAVSTLYLSFHAEYGDVINAFRTIDYAVDKYKLNGGKLDKGYWKNGDIIAKLKDEVGQKINSGTDENEKEKWETVLVGIKYLEDKNNKNKIDEYLDFNDGKTTGYVGKNYEKIDDAGALSWLKWCLEQVAEEVWDLAEDKLEDKIVYEDFTFTEADVKALKSGGQTNALFSGLLHIGIILNSAYDQIVLLNDSEDKYKEMQATMLLHVQRTQRFYDKLAKERKEFGVDTLIVRFVEEFATDEKRDDGKLTDRELAERLRKQTIRVLSLTPMLLKTNSLLSKYVVQYPQKQMGESLERIAQKRFYGKSSPNSKRDTYRWFWEKDYYHAVSNYYYVAAIFDFYDYYKNYEKHYISDYAKFVEDLKKDTVFSNSLTERYQEIEDEFVEKENKWRAEVAEANERAKEAEEKNTEAEGAELVAGIKGIVEKTDYFDKPEFMKRVIEGIRKQLANELAEKYAGRYKKPEKQQEIKEALGKPVEPKDDTVFSLLKALLIDMLLPSSIEGNIKPEMMGYDGCGAITVGNSGSFSESDKNYQPAEIAIDGRKRFVDEKIFDVWIADLFNKYLDW